MLRRLLRFKGFEFDVATKNQQVQTKTTSSNNDSLIMKNYTITIASLIKSEMSTNKMARSQLLTIIVVSLLLTLILIVSFIVILYLNLYK